MLELNGCCKCGGRIVRRNAMGEQAHAFFIWECAECGQVVHRADKEDGTDTSENVNAETSIHIR